MAVTYQSAGSVHTGTPIRPPYPASTALGDLLILAVGVKSAASSVNTPTGWLELGNFSGTTGTTGGDVGPTKVYLFAKVVDGIEDLSGAMEITGSWNSPWAQVFRFSNATGFWDLSFSGGEDTAGGTTWSATMSSAMDIASGDVMLAASVDPTDSSHTYSSPTVASTGATYGAATLISQPRSSSGNDIGGFNFTQPVSSGSSSDAPVVTASVSGTTGNVYGPTALLRIREVTEGGQPTNEARLAASATTVAASPDGEARLSSVSATVAAIPESAARWSSVMIEVMTPRDKTIHVSSLASSAAFGLPNITQVAEDQEFSLNSLGSAASLGQPAITSNVTVEVNSLGSSAAFGQPAVTAASEISVDSLTSAASFGQPTVTQQSEVYLTSLTSAASFGQPTISTSVEVSPSSLGSAAAFGAPEISATSEILVTSLASPSQFGSPNLTAAAVIELGSLSSSTSFGLPEITLTGFQVLVESLASAATFGNPAFGFLTGVTPDEVMRQEVLAVEADRNSCTVLSGRRVTDLGKVTIEEDVLDVSLT